MEGTIHRAGEPWEQVVERLLADGTWQRPSFKEQNLGAADLVGRVVFVKGIGQGTIKAAVTSKLKMGPSGHVIDSMGRGEVEVKLARKGNAGTPWLVMPPGIQERMRKSKAGKMETYDRMLREKRRQQAELVRQSERLEREENAVASKIQEQEAADRRESLKHMWKQRASGGPSASNLSSRSARSRPPHGTPRERRHRGRTVDQRRGADADDSAGSGSGSIVGAGAAAQLSQAGGAAVQPRSVVARSNENTPSTVARLSRAIDAPVPKPTPPPVREPMSVPVEKPSLPSEMLRHEVQEQEQHAVYNIPCGQGRLAMNKTTADEGQWQHISSGTPGPRGVKGYYAPTMYDAVPNAATYHGQLRHSVEPNGSLSQPATYEAMEMQQSQQSQPQLWQSSLPQTYGEPYGTTPGKMASRFTLPPPPSPPQKQLQRVSPDYIPHDDEVVNPAPVWPSAAATTLHWHEQGGEQIAGGEPWMSVEPYSLRHDTANDHIDEYPRAAAAAAAATAAVAAAEDRNEYEYLVENENDYGNRNGNRYRPSQRFDDPDNTAAPPADMSEHPPPDRPSEMAELPQLQRARTQCEELSARLQRMREQWQYNNCDPSEADRTAENDMVAQQERLQRLIAVAVKVENRGVLHDLSSQRQLELQTYKKVTETLRARIAAASIGSAEAATGGSTAAFVHIVSALLDLDS